MEITMNELLEGKSTIIKNKQFLSTKAYIEPFVDRMSAFTNDFKIQVKTPDQITTTGGNRDVTFNRQWEHVEAIMYLSVFSLLLWKEILHGSRETQRQ